jgi:calcium/calmodulin-dependent protein kinase I
MSILDLSNKPRINQKRFWKPLYTSFEITKEPVVHKGHLYIRATIGLLGHHEMNLTSKYIYYKNYLSETLISKINWSLVESFLEPSNKTLKYGFKLSTTFASFDFYTESQKALDEWIEKLSTVCLSTGFEFDYVTIKEIDSGKFGKVFLCQDIENKCEYAVKTIPKLNLNSQSRLINLRNEIKIMRKLDHNDCIKLYKIYEDDDFISLVMEYLPYGNLLQRIEKIKVFSENDVSLFMIKMMNVLAYMHSLGVIHRDIKPQNILMTSDVNNYCFKIVDFGLATFVQKAGPERCGTAGFIAPEVLEEALYTPKADVFSAGVIGYTMLTGTCPFISNKTKNVLEKNGKCDIKFSKKVWKNTTKDSLDFIKSTLKKDPNTRLSSEEALDSPWLMKNHDIDTDL